VWDHICSLFPGENIGHVHNAQHIQNTPQMQNAPYMKSGGQGEQVYNGGQEEQVQDPWPSFSWPIIQSDGGYCGLNHENQSYILPIHHGFFGADDASQVWSNQGETRGVCPKNEDCLVCPGDGAGADDRPCHQEKGDVFGILRDHSPCVCAVVQQKRLRTSWYL
jgi:hypothetical protein